MVIAMPAAGVFAFYNDSYRLVLSGFTGYVYSKLLFPCAGNRASTTHRTPPAAFSISPTRSSCNGARGRPVTPFLINSVVVGEIDRPQAIIEPVARKVQASRENERKETELQLPLKS